MDKQRVVDVLDDDNITMQVGDIAVWDDEPFMTAKVAIAGLRSDIAAQNLLVNDLRSKLSIARSDAVIALVIGLTVGVALGYGVSFL